MVALVLVLLLPACSSTPAATQTPTKASAKPPAPTEAKSSAPGALADAVIGVGCDEPRILYAPVSSITVSTISLTNGTETVIAQFPLSAVSSTGFVPTISCRATGSIVRQLFDNAYTRVAVKWEDKTGVRHVGWVTTDGVLVDITAKISGSGGFSKGAKDVNPLFDPFTDQFFYVDSLTDEAVWVDPDSQAVVKRVPIEGGYTGTGGYIAYVGAPGQLSWWQEGVQNHVLSPKGQKVLIYPTQYYVGWLSADKLLVIGENANRLAVEPVDSRCEENGNNIPACTPTYITPETDYRLGEGAVNSKTGKIVFVARNQANQSYLFATTIDGGEPKQLTSIQDTFHLIELTE